jgi:hypothetical protein
MQRRRLTVPPCVWWARRHCRGPLHRPCTHASLVRLRACVAGHVHAQHGRTGHGDDLSACVLAAAQEARGAVGQGTAASRTLSPRNCAGRAATGASAPRHGQSCKKCCTFDRCTELPCGLHGHMPRPRSCPCAACATQTDFLVKMLRYAVAQQQPGATEDEGLPSDPSERQV